MPSIKKLLEARLKDIKSLPVLPSVTLVLTRSLADEKTGAEDVARILAQDPSLSAKVLTIVNSAQYAPGGQKTSSLATAVARLGFQEVSRLFTTLSIVRTFGQTGQKLDYDHFWKHSVTAGIAARSVGKKCRKAGIFSRDDAYIAGLLHDAGLLILDQFLPDVFAQVDTMAKQKQIPLAAAERSLLGMDHGQIGGRLLECWGLPATVTDAVRWHHFPSEAPDEHRPSAAILDVADRVCSLLNLGDSTEAAFDGFGTAAQSTLGLSDEDLAGVVREVTAETARTEILLALAK